MYFLRVSYILWSKKGIRHFTYYMYFIKVSDKKLLLCTKEFRVKGFFCNLQADNLIQMTKFKPKYILLFIITLQTLCNTVL